jgi:hypothetical protein
MFNTAADIRIPRSDPIIRNRGGALPDLLKEIDRDKIPQEFNKSRWFPKER